MQGSSEKLSDEAIEETLEKVVRLLAYISDKDLFAEFFRKKLARRLLNSNSASDEHERSILSRLKQQCGAQFTSKVAPAPPVYESYAYESYYDGYDEVRSWLTMLMQAVVAQAVGLQQDGALPNRACAHTYLLVMTLLLQLCTGISKPAQDYNIELEIASGISELSSLALALTTDSVVEKVVVMALSISGSSWLLTPHLRIF